MMTACAPQADVGRPKLRPRKPTLIPWRLTTIATLRGEWAGVVMRDDLRTILLSGERVLWDGEPYNGLMSRPIEAFLIPFSLLWGGFAVFWNVQVWSTGQDVAALPFKLFGLPFLIGGLYVTFGRFLLDMQIRRRLRYAVTDRRILIYRSGRSSTSKSIDIKRLPAIELDERADGSGTIRFGPAMSLFGGGSFGIWQPTFDATPQFLRIPNVRFVYELIQKQTDL